MRKAGDNCSRSRFQEFRHISENKLEGVESGVQDEEMRLGNAIWGPRGVGGKRSRGLGNLGNGIEGVDDMHCDRFSIFLRWISAMDLINVCGGFCITNSKFSKLIQCRDELTIHDMLNLIKISCD